jgi:hypothetical protein
LCWCGIRLKRNPCSAEAGEPNRETGARLRVKGANRDTKVEGFVIMAVRRRDYINQNLRITARNLCGKSWEPENL